MKKRFFSLALCILLCFSMVCPSVLAEDSVPEHEHKWVDCGINFDGEVKEIPVSVSVQQCSVCKMYLHSFNILGNVIKYPAITGYTTMTNELVQFLAPYVAQLLGKNATATKAPSGIGRKDLPGYADDKGTASIGADGKLNIYIPVTGWAGTRNNIDNKLYAGSGTPSVLYHSANIQGTTFSNAYSGVVVYLTFTAPISGTYHFASNQKFASYSHLYNQSWETKNAILSSGYDFGFYAGNKYYLCFAFSGGASYNFIASGTGLVASITPIETLVNKQTNITINNNTWNGNIYTDNSTNLTYIYPQYTTVNEKNETVTNISNNPIIYNNETKKYYTYDTITNNYYYITYEQPTAPTPSPSPSPSPSPAPTETPAPSEPPTPTPDPGTTPTPTPKPGGGISTPETGKPGGDSGDTTGILAVLVEIRDNMIQGFLDIKAAFVAGFAELSANFTLAIENLNVNIQNIFNKKFPDQSTPETALPSPTPSPNPAPLDPILPETQNLIIPKMNSNTFTDEHGTWVASGSSKYSDVFDFFYAFDRSSANFWETNAKPSYLQVEIPDPESYYIDGYIMRISKFNNRYAKDWTLQGSDDGKTWYDLDTQKDQNLSDMEEHKYTLSLRKAYKYYRLNMSNYASSMCSLSHFNLLGYDAKDVVTPTPAPTEPPSPTPSPSPAPTGKPDGGGDTNNFWNIFIGGGSDDGTDGDHKGIFWALVSLILALIAFFTNMFAGVAYLFPFLPEGVVMTINTCLFVVFLFVIIKFIMRSK